jgi:FtsP/CotA-like multicopper oxidase with cupredoxin domain
MQITYVFDAEQTTLTNGGAIPHSIAFHAARIAPNVAFRDVAPGASFTFRFRANDPGVFTYHCGTKPVLAHIANGMYDAIVVDPVKPLPHADHEYVLVASEWYLKGPGIRREDRRGGGPTPSSATPSRTSISARSACSRSATRRRR